MRASPLCDTQPSATAPILARIDEVNRRLTPLEVGFLDDARRGGTARRRRFSRWRFVGAAVILGRSPVLSCRARIVRAGASRPKPRLYAEHDQRAQVTLESIGDAVITTDERGRIDYLNPVAESLAGLPTAEAQGKPFEHAIHLAKETDRQAVVNPAADLFRGGARGVKSSGDTILAWSRRPRARSRRVGRADPGSREPASLAPCSC